MIHRNESCTSGQVPMSYLCCLIYILEEWTGVEYLEDYLNYVAYLLWVFTPLIIVFILPGLILLLLYISIIFLYVYKRKNELKEAYSNDIWDGARQMVATLWDGHARIWHGYEVHGLEKIPEGPGLVVFYHGATPIDYFYFLAKLLILKNRMCYTVADHFVFKLPASRTEMGKLQPGDHIRPAGLSCPDPELLAWEFCPRPLPCCSLSPVAMPPRRQWGCKLLAL
ncbi:DGAT1/2-independent enzyme synthesizing storage lipids isoform X7 [Caretta caretta]|uniref:DGAT1/2-independent enzyme synthesizing storage lipids isoform X7 n=1 Tax=Caretta caretta TaxID=8467 RepID=UPI003F4C1A25